jgi:hypothetical protein
MCRGFQNHDFSARFSRNEAAAHHIRLLLEVPVFYTRGIGCEVASQSELFRPRRGTPGSRHGGAVEMVVFDVLLCRPWRLLR